MPLPAAGQDWKSQTFVAADCLESGSKPGTAKTFAKRERSLRGRMVAEGAVNAVLMAGLSFIEWCRGDAIEPAGPAPIPTDGGLNGANGMPFNETAKDQENAPFRRLQTLPTASTRHEYSTQAVRVRTRERQPFRGLPRIISAVRIPAGLAWQLQIELFDGMARLSKAGNKHFRVWAMRARPDFFLSDP
jgi:hypothetical protein